jgi:SSS family solute:Na+ symporter
MPVFAAMLLAVLFTWNDVLGIGGVGGFTYIQKYTGFISPGVFAMFFLGMFWKRTTGTAAVVGVISGFLLSVLFNEYAPMLFGNETLLYTAWPNGKGGFEIPFHICMGLSFVFTMLLMIAVSFAGPKVNPKAFELDTTMFKLKPQTTVLIVITLLIIFALYVKFW